MLSIKPNHFSKKTYLLAMNLGRWVSGWTVVKPVVADSSYLEKQTIFRTSFSEIKSHFRLDPPTPTLINGPTTPPHNTLGKILFEPCFKQVKG